MRIIFLSIAMLFLSFTPTHTQSSQREQRNKHSDYNTSIGANIVKTYLCHQARKATLNQKDITVDVISLTISHYLIYDYKINPSEYYLFFTISSTLYQNYYNKQSIQQPKADKKDKRILKTIRETLRASNSKHEHYAFYALINQYNTSKQINSNKEQHFIDLFYSSKPFKTQTPQFQNKRMLTSIVDNAYKIYLKRKNYIIGPCHLPSKNNNPHYTFFVSRLPKTSTVHENMYEKEKILVNTGVVYEWNKHKKQITHHNEKIRRKSKVDIGDLDHGLSLIACSDINDLQSDKNWAVVTFLPDGLKIKQQGKDYYHYVILPTETEKEDLFIEDYFKAYQLNCNKLILMGVTLFSSILEKHNNNFEKMKKAIMEKYCF